MQSRKTPSNSIAMRRPASDAGMSNVRRYQPMLVSGNARPSGFAPWPLRPRSSLKGRSIAQSCGRSTAVHAASSNVAWVTLPRPPIRLPDFANAPPRP